MPGSPPPSPPDLDRFVWETLAPRLLGKVKLRIIQTLLKERRPLSSARLRELGELGICRLVHVEHHTKHLERAGVLEVVGEEPRPDGGGTEPTYYFPPPPASSPSTAAA
jgi:hypothetical protein